MEFVKFRRCALVGDHFWSLLHTLRCTVFKDCGPQILSILKQWSTRTSGLETFKILKNEFWNFHHTESFWFESFKVQKFWTLKLSSYVFCFENFKVRWICMFFSFMNFVNLFFQSLKLVWPWDLDVGTDS